MMEDLFREMEIYAEENHVPIIRAAARDVFLQAVKEAAPRRILEIGTAIGYSALLMADALPELESITTLELSEDRAALAQGYIDRSPYRKKIDILTGDAGELLNSLDKKYDLVFIDAAKGQYPDYWRKIQPLLTDRAAVLADNVLFRGYVLGTEPVPRRFRTIAKRLREYLALVEETTGFSTEILPDGDGLAVSRRR